VTGECALEFSDALENQMSYFLNGHNRLGCPLVALSGRPRKTHPMSRSGVKQTSKWKGFHFRAF